MPNRTRPNSHFGCTNCKLKKVKCDELYPSCTRCLRQRIVCQYKKPTFTLSAGGAGKCDGDSTSPNDENGSLSGAVPGTEFDDAQLCDLELMYHYTMYTARSLGARQDGPAVHLTGMPTLATKNIFVMHAMLAVAALHYVIHHKIPEQPQRQKYFDIHARHNALAARTSRDVLAANKPDDVHAMFAYKVLLTEAAYATAHILNETATDPMENVIEIWRQARECTTLVAVSARILATGPLWSLIRPDTEAEMMARKFLRRVYPVEVLTILRARLMEASSASVTMPYYYKHAVDLLDSMLIYTDYDALATDWRTNGWCNLIKPEIMEAITNREDEAMILVAYYMVALHHAKCLVWVGNIAEKVMSYIYEQLGDRYSQILAWPLMMISGDATPIMDGLPHLDGDSSHGHLDGHTSHSHLDGHTSQSHLDGHASHAHLDGHAHPYRGQARPSTHSSRSGSSTAGSMHSGIMSAPGPPLTSFYVPSMPLDRLGGMMM